MTTLPQTETAAAVAVAVATHQQALFKTEAVLATVVTAATAAIAAIAATAVVTRQSPPLQVTMAVQNHFC